MLESDTRSTRLALKCPRPNQLSTFEEMLAFGAVVVRLREQSVRLLLRAAHAMMRDTSCPAQDWRWRSLSPSVWSAVSELLACPSEPAVSRGRHRKSIYD